MINTIRKSKNWVLLVLLLPISILAQEKDQCQSPYFQITGNESNIEQLPLNYTKAQVSIAGVIANITVQQQYKNQGTQAIEAIYVFPASTRAAVHYMEMKIGERTITAVVKEKKEARQEYEQALNEGKTAALLEQQRPNVFQMNVGNILPGDVIDVTLGYSELLVPVNDVYEFVYPTVVGPRYTNSNKQPQHWTSNPYTSEDKQPLYDFDININLSTGVPVSAINSSSHKVDIAYTSGNSATIKLAKNQTKSGNKDFILRYKLKGNTIEAGTLLYESSGENFFLTIMQPPMQIKPDLIPPREYIFIVDISGSMRGFPLDVSKNLMQNLLTNLNPGDKFNILLFAGGSELFKPASVEANEQNIQAGIRFLNMQHGGGGTEILSALQQALSLEGAEAYSRSFVILTDGYVNVEKKTFEFIHNNLGQANFFAFGIGSSVNRYIIEGIGYIGKAESFIATNASEAKNKASEFRTYIENPVLTNIKVNFNKFNAYDVEPVSVPDIFAKRPVIIFGKYRGEASGSIEITGLSGNKNFHKVMEVESKNADKTNEAIKYLWAREKIRYLHDFDKISYSHENKALITALGLKYNLLTEYTSFVAIDSNARNTEGNPIRIEQTLPLPEGVSNSALHATQVFKSASPNTGVPRGTLSKNMTITPNIKAYQRAEEKTLPNKKLTQVEDYLLNELRKELSIYNTYRYTHIRVDVQVNKNYKAVNFSYPASLASVLKKRIEKLLMNYPEWEKIVSGSHMPIVISINFMLD